MYHMNASLYSEWAQINNPEAKALEDNEYEDIKKLQYNGILNIFNKMFLNLIGKIFIEKI